MPSAFPSFARLLFRFFDRSAAADRVRDLLVLAPGRIDNLSPDCGRVKIQPDLDGNRGSGSDAPRGILVLLASLIALVVFPFRRGIRRIVIEWLSRAAEGDKGVLAFSAATFVLLGFFVSLIPKLLFGPLGLS
jgi:hypothetical protein